MGLWPKYLKDVFLEINSLWMDTQQICYACSFSPGQKIFQLVTSALWCHLNKVDSEQDDSEYDHSSHP